MVVTLILGSVGSGKTTWVEKNKTWGDLVVDTLGEALSGSAAFGIWPETGRCEAWLAFGDRPSVVERGRLDGARYDLMLERGELRTYPGRITPVAAFLSDLAKDLEGCRVHRIASDSFKDSKVKERN